MKKYKVLVTETTWGYYLIEADNADEAEEKYYEGEYEGEIRSKNGEYQVESVEEVIEP